LFLWYYTIILLSWFQVSVSPASSVVKDTPSSITKESENGEISTDSQDEEKVTLGDALSMNRPSEAPPTSVEELQNLAGGADIKVLKLDLLLLSELPNVSPALH
jgi:guanine nucleotide-exchange factor